MVTLEQAKLMMWTADGPWVRVPRDEQGGWTGSSDYNVHEPINARGIVAAHNAMLARALTASPAPTCIACAEGKHQHCLGGRCECIHDPGASPAPAPQESEPEPFKTHLIVPGGKLACGHEGRESKACTHDARHVDCADCLRAATWPAAPAPPETPTPLESTEETDDRSICEGCDQPIDGPALRTADDVELCEACADELLASTSGPREVRSAPAPETPEALPAEMPEIQVGDVVIAIDGEAAQVDAICPDGTLRCDACMPQYLSISGVLAIYRAPLWQRKDGAR